MSAGVMIHNITSKELDDDPFLHGSILGLQIALNRYVRLITLDGELSERAMVRLTSGELRDIQIISTDDRIVVQLAID